MVLLVLGIGLAGCQSQRGLLPADVPTPADLDALATALPLTQYAPPAPYTAGTDDFARIDAGLAALPGWRAVGQVQFTGVYADDVTPAVAEVRIEINFNQVASARRITFASTGDLLAGEDADAPTGYEAVRLGPDAFVVRDGQCFSGENAATAADLGAGDLVGGVTQALPVGRPSAVINGEMVFPFVPVASSSTGDPAGLPAGLILPVLTIQPGGEVRLDSAELWIAPERRVVVRYYANLTVANVRLFDQERAVSGTLVLRYDVYDLGTAFNLTVPFGC